MKLLVRVGNQDIGLVELGKIKMNLQENIQRIKEVMELPTRQSSNYTGVDNTYVKKPIEKKIVQTSSKDLSFNKITSLTINNIEGGYYHPNFGSKGMGKSGETMFGMDRKHGVDFTNSTAGTKFWQLIDNDKKLNPKKWVYLYTLHDNLKLRLDLINLISQYWLQPTYESYTKKYLTPEAKEIVDKTPKLKYHMSYGVWNGEGWFRRFAKKINDAISNGEKNIENLFKLSIMSRLNSGNSIIAKSGKIISDVISKII